MLEKRPNILLLLTDDQRFDTIAALGNPAVHTPNFDRLVERGMAFENAYIMGGSSGAVCMPSRAMLHTSRTLYHLLRGGDEIDAGHALLGEHLQTAGFDAFGAGKWHNGPDAYARSFSAGGPVFFGGMSDHWNVPVCDFNPSGDYPVPRRTLQRWGAKIVDLEQRYERFTSGVHSTDLFVDSACDWLRTRDAEHPFFAYVSFMAPHDPREMPAEHLNRYDPASVDLPPNFAPHHPFDTGFLDTRDELLADFPRGEDEIRRHIAEYHAMVSHIDDRVGDLLDTIESRGQLENTVIVLAGDNGLAVGQHGLLGKQCCYDHSLHVPLLISGPGVPVGRSRELCYLIDIFPTLCELCGIDTPATVEGRSLMPVMKGENAGARDELVFAITQMQRAIRDQRWKLIETAVPATRRTQLFDLDNDPLETCDLSDSPRHAATLKRLRESLRQRWQQLHDDRVDQGADFWRRYDASEPVQKPVSSPRS